MTMITAYNELQQRVEALAQELPGISFGYIGNSDGWNGYDDRSWSVFLPHPGRVGVWADKVGSYPTSDLDRMLADWPRLEVAVRTGMSSDGVRRRENTYLGCTGRWA